MVRRRRAFRVGLGAALAILFIAGLSTFRSSNDSSLRVTGHPRGAVAIELAPVLEQHAAPCPAGFVPQRQNGVDLSCYRLGAPALVIRRADVRQAELAANPSGGWRIDLTLRSTAARTLDRVAREHLGQQLAVSVEGTVLIAPTVESTQFNGRMEIAVDTRATAERLATALGATLAPGPSASGPGAQDNSERVAVGGIVLTLPNGFTIESQDDLDYANGAKGRTVLIGSDQRAVGLVAARCQVAFLEFPAGAFPPDDRPRSTIHIQPVDGSPAFDMVRVEGSDTDLGGTIGETQSFIVDCDDPPTAQLVAAHITLPK
jgi:hypothetical protein